jgi:hypothetical protein
MPHGKQGWSFKAATSVEESAWMKWHVSEITLEAHYGGAHAPLLTVVPCDSVSELEEERDGSLRRILLVNGINPRAVKELGWKPQRLSFADEGTGKTHHFDVLPGATDEPKAVKFAIR